MRKIELLCEIVILICLFAALLMALTPSGMAEDKSNFVAGKVSSSHNLGYETPTYGMLVSYTLKHIASEVEVLRANKIGDTEPGLYWAYRGTYELRFRDDLAISAGGFVSQQRCSWVKTAAGPYVGLAIQGRNSFDLGWRGDFYSYNRVQSIEATYLRRFRRLIVGSRVSVPIYKFGGGIETGVSLSGLLGVAF